MVADRRRFLVLGVAALVLGIRPRGAGANLRSVVEGCTLLQAQRGATPPGERIETSGDTALDRALGRHLVHFAQEFDLYPGFSFYDDHDAPNAIAVPFSGLENTTGEVRIGINLLRIQLDAPHDGNIALVGILAHELGHIIQYFSPYYWQLRKAHATAKLVELHADFFAGYIVGRQPDPFQDIRLQRLRAAWEAMGDVDYNNPKHHGTSAERLAAIEEGYFWGRDNDGNWREAAEAGARFVKERFA